MYVTRPLSHYKKFPNSLSLPPPEGPNSGYLVIQDEESVDTTCFGLCRDTPIRTMPFPQDKILKIIYSTPTYQYEDGTGAGVAFAGAGVDGAFAGAGAGAGAGVGGAFAGAGAGVGVDGAFAGAGAGAGVGVLDGAFAGAGPQPVSTRTDYHDYVYFIPVLNQPLSSNRYYVIKAHGRHKGEAYVSSREEDNITCCWFNFSTDLTPRELHPEDAYQQIEIRCRSNGYVARSVAQDGVPPHFLARKGWEVDASTPSHYQLFEAQGVNASLRARLPQFNFPLSSKSSEIVVVGKWYTPFMFIKEEGRLKDQMKRSMFYEVTLKQQWKQVYECDNNLNDDHNFVVVDVSVDKEVALLFGKEALHNLTNVTEGVIWFSTGNGAVAGGGESRVGLSSAVVERMRWEQERVGWIGGREKQVRVERVEEFEGGKHGWKKYGCYILVEWFVFKRMDRSLLLTYEFRHAQQIRSKWE